MVLSSLGDVNSSVQVMTHDSQRLKLFTQLQKKMRARKTKLTSGLSAALPSCHLPCASFLVRLRPPLGWLRMRNAVQRPMSTQ
jgi:hypothetical protein